MAIAIGINGCSHKNAGQTNNGNRPYQTFSKDANTVASKDEAEKFSSLSNSEMEEYRKKMYELEVENSYVSELIITGSNDELDYEVSGDDIIYDGRVFKDLNRCIDEIEFKISRTSMINMIVKSFDNYKNTVYCDVTNDKIYRESDERLALAGGDDYEQEPTYYLEDALHELNGYDEVVSRHNGEGAFWMLEMHSEYSDGHIYGSSSYMLCHGKEPVTINLDELSKFNITGTATEIEGSDSETDESGMTTEETSTETGEAMEQ